MRRFGLLLLIFLTSLPIASAQEKKSERKPTTIAADRLEVDRKHRTAVYSGNVVLNDKENDLTILADRMQFFFDEKMEEVQKAVATGNVRITQGNKRSLSERAEYFPTENLAVLTGNPKVWQDEDQVSGSRITLFFREDRAIAEGGEKGRVEAIIYPKGKKPALSEGEGKEDQKSGQDP